VGFCARRSGFRPSPVWTFYGPNGLVRSLHLREFVYCCTVGVDARSYSRLRKNSGKRGGKHPTYCATRKIVKVHLSSKHGQIGRIGPGQFDAARRLSRACAKHRRKAIDIPCRRPSTYQCLDKTLSGGIGSQFLRNNYEKVLCDCNAGNRQCA